MVKGGRFKAQGTRVLGMDTICNISIRQDLQDKQDFFRFQGETVKIATVS
jgi:hypothetical protein